jgi:S-adenosylmethionine decarboxylase
VSFGAEHEHAVYLFHTDRHYTPEENEATLEILMHGIDPTIAERFRSLEILRGGSIAEELGLAEVLPRFELDEHVFEPNGYSVNGLCGAAYATIHVTPEDLGSYASFETNMDFHGDLRALIQRVVGRFKPESFDVVAFLPDARAVSVDVAGYSLRKHMLTEAGGFQVAFQHWFRAAEIELG